MKKSISIILIGVLHFVNLGYTQDLGSERAFDIYKKPILSTFFEEPYYPTPREELVSTQNMYERKKVSKEIDMLYEIQRKEHYRQQQAAKYENSVERFRNKFNVQSSGSDGRPRFRAQTDVRQVNPFHDPYMMSPRGHMMHPLYRSSFMRPGLYMSSSTQIETSLNKKEEPKQDKN